MQTLPDDATLIVVDVQQAFDNKRWGERNNPDAEINIGRLLTAWRATSRPIIHVQHRNTGAGKLFSPDRPGFQFKPEAAPQGSEPVITKQVNSAVIGTDLETRLRRADITHLVICGLTTDHCVSTTARTAANLRFTIDLVADACATFERVGPGGRHWSAQQMHDSALASLHVEFARVTDTAPVIESTTSRPGSRAGDSPAAM
jgi:nicotinamidase-related amidase